MKVMIVRSKKARTTKMTERLDALLEQARTQRDDREPELAVSAGGDGALLSTFHHYGHCLNDVRLLDIHAGHLGFYAGWRSYELEELVDSLQTNREQSVSYPLLDVRISCLDEAPDQRFLALNESVVKRANHTMVADVYIKGGLFENFRGNGLTVSTPTGSAAYNRGVDGAAVHSSINTFQSAEIVPPDNRVFRTLDSLIMIVHSGWPEIKLESTEGYLVTVDQSNIAKAGIRLIYYQITEKRIHPASY